MDFQKGGGGGGGGGGGEERRSYPVTAADYKILEEVGQGVSATVYRALCTPFNETVAIKSLDLEKCISNLDEIRKEAQMMSLIAHANVVKAYCSFVVDRSLWVVMPYMAGGSCLHIMKSAYPEGFEEPVIATVLKEVLKALDYLHRHGHIHRDVKAGNILVDSNGQVKLGDFGVSACMFDTGDRQRSRNTFVGTPCWMAPEVMEQLHGYDFKADIWSFGITALELAHGHAPFSKYPPMKVLLMTLQNAPPGLDYERDKRFSKSFKEMIAMCLVKDPAKRPSAEKLLKHSFFKHARSYDYIAKHVLEGLPPLGERVKNLKAKDAARLAQKKMPYGEQEERSQNEYKRGVSSWNFNVEDLKAQAALLDDEEAASTKEVVDSPKGRGQKDSSSEDGKDSSDNQSGWSLPSDTREFLPSPGPLNSPRGEGGQSDRVPRARSGPLPSGNQVAKATNGSKPGAINLGRKESRHSLGRFEVEDVDLDRPDWHEDSKVRAGDERDQSRRSDEQERELDREEGRTGAGGAGSLRSRDDDRERGDGRLEHRSAGGGTRSVEDLPRINVLRERNPSMPVMCGSSNKDVPDEKLKGTFVQKKGRFSVTSDDVALDDVPQAAAASVRRGLNVQSLSLHKSASVGDWASERERKHSQAPHTSSASQSPTHKSVNAGNWSSDRKHSLHSSSAAQLHSPALFQLTSNSAATVPVAAIFPHLQTMLQQCQSQQELVVNLLNSMHVAVDPPATTTGASRLSHLGSKSFMNSSSSLSIATSEASLEVSTDKERDLLDQVAGLQSRIASLVDELQVVKFRNVQLERQLNAIYNKEEEERIRKEEAAKEEG